MKCIDCQYDLSAITGDRCPECGRSFDSRDASTYASSSQTWTAAWSKNWQARIAAISTLIALLHVVSGYVALVIGRLDLARWPIRTGQDDPKSINGVTLCLCIFWLLTFHLQLLAFCVWFFSSTPLWFQMMNAQSHYYIRRTRHRVLLAISTCIWLLAFLELSIDPAMIYPWMID